MTQKKVVLRDGTEVTLRPETDGDLEYAWEMFSSISDNTLEFLPEGFSRERVEGQRSISTEPHLESQYTMIIREKAWVSY
ncbi:hypothetical protein KQH65_10690 [archaeon]|nr:hypothetical protein [archaeon]